MAKLKTPKPRKMSDLEIAWDTYKIQCASDLPDPQPEFRFDEVRMWRIDKAYPDKKIAVELQGGTWSGGRHVRGQGVSDDYEKFNAMVMQGWRVLLLTTDMLYSDPFAHFEQLRQLLKDRDRRLAEAYQKIARYESFFETLRQLLNVDEQRGD